MHALSASLETWCFVLSPSPRSLPSLPSSPLFSSPFPLLLLFALVLDLLVLLPSYFSDSLSLFTNVFLSPATMQGISVFLVKEAIRRTNAWKIGSTWIEQRYLRWHPSPTHSCMIESLTSRLSAVKGSEDTVWATSITANLIHENLESGNST